MGGRCVGVPDSVPPAHNRRLDHRSRVGGCERAIRPAVGGLWRGAAADDVSRCVDGDHSGSQLPSDTGACWLQLVRHSGDAFLRQDVLRPGQPPSPFPSISLLLRSLALRHRHGIDVGWSTGWFTAARRPGIEIRGSLSGSQLAARVDLAAEPRSAIGVVSSWADLLCSSWPWWALPVCRSSAAAGMDAACAHCRWRCLGRGSAARVRAKAWGLFGQGKLAPEKGGQGRRRGPLPLYPG